MSSDKCSICGGERHSVGPCPVCGAPEEIGDSAVQRALMPGTMIGRHRLGRVLGEGGFGITYAGYDTSLERRVAVKELFIDGSVRKGTTVVPPSATRSSGGATWKASVDRFVEEGRTIAKFTGVKGVVAVHEVVMANNTAYLVMELLDGVSLSSRLEGLDPLNET